MKNKQTNLARCVCFDLVNLIFFSWRNNNEQIRDFFLANMVFHNKDQNWFHLFIAVTSADKNQIKKIMANTCSLIWIGSVMIFVSKACLYISSIPELKIRKKKLLNFSKWWIFFVANFLKENKRFCKYQLILWSDLENYFSSENSSDKYRTHSIRPTSWIDRLLE